MSITSTVRGALAELASKAATLLTTDTARDQGLVAMVRSASRPATIQTLPEAYRRNPWAFTATNAIAQNAASVPIRLMKARGDDDAEEITSGSPLNEIAYPNPTCTGFQLWEATISWLVLSGNLKRAAPVLAALATLATAGGWNIMGIVEIILSLLPAAVGNIGLTEIVKRFLENLGIRMRGITTDLPRAAKVGLAILLGVVLGAITETDVVALLPEGYAIDDGTITGVLSALIFAIVQAVKKKDVPQG